MEHSSNVGLALVVGLGAVLSAVACGASPATDSQRTYSDEGLSQQAGFVAF